MTTTPPEAIEAALALVQSLAVMDPDTHADVTLSGAAREARRIAALLPKPVDEAVLACREIVAGMYHPEGHDGEMMAYAITGGTQDNHRDMQLVLSAYRAGAASTKGDALAPVSRP